MSHDDPKGRGRRSGIDHEEERAWIGFYRRVGHDVAVAAEVLGQLEGDPDAKRRHLALFLCCKESLRSHKARQQRHRRIGVLVRGLCHGLFVAPPHAVAHLVRRCGELALECLPQVRREPAVPKVRRLTQSPEFAAAQSAFLQHAAAPSADESAASPAPSRHLPQEAPPDRRTA
jgi:hypothetical protein